MSKSAKGRDYGLSHRRTLLPGNRVTPAGRGEWSVEEDSLLYVYQKLPGRPDCRDIKSWIAQAFARSDRKITICGRYPNYWIE